MNEAADVEQPVDGRVARRDRNRNAVLDAVLDMFGEDMLWPSIELASERSGLSLRSVYRYFPDPAALVEAAIRRNIERNLEYGLLPSIGRGPLGKRIDDLVTMRVRLFERISPVYRATMHNARTTPGSATDCSRRGGCSGISSSGNSPRNLTSSARRAGRTRSRPATC